MRAAAFLACLLCAAFLPLPAGAAGGGFRASLSASEGWEGDFVELRLSYDGPEAVGVAFFQVDFDPGSFEYREARPAASVREGVSATVTEEGRAASGYTLHGEGSGLAAGEVFTYRFKVREGAPQGPAVFSASVYGVCDPSGEALPGLERSLTYTVLPPPSTDASLLSLAPSAGTLTPDFSPDCCDYEVTVPFSVTSLSFSVQPAAGAVCKVNRKNLGAGGSDTEFLLTVTAEDLRTRTVYRVTAHREEKASSPKPSPTPRPSSTPRPTATPRAAASPRPTATARPSATQKPTATPKPDKTAPPVAEPVHSSTPPPEPTGTPVPLAAAESSPPLRETEASPAQAPALELRAGEDSGLALWGVGLLAAVAVLSRPLAKLIVGKAGDKKPPEE